CSRQYNRLIVQEPVRLNSPTTRGEIASRVGLTVQTVSTIVRELEEQNYLVSFRENPKGRGLPPTFLRLNPEGGFAIGVHLTPVGIAAALVDLSGNVVASSRRAVTNASPDSAFK